MSTLFTPLLGTDVARTNPSSKDSPSCHCVKRHTLLQAVAEGSITCMASIIKRGDGLCAALLERDAEGHNALELAVKKGYDSGVKSLLLLGKKETSSSTFKGLVDPERKDGHGNTLLILAAGACQVSTIALLFHLGAKANAANNDGHTALHVAALNGHLHAIAALYERAPELTYRCDHKHDRDFPVDLAAIHGHVDAMKLLLHHMEAEKLRGKALAGYAGPSIPVAQARYFLAAVRGGHRSIVEELLKGEARLRLVCACGYAQRRAIHYAAWGAHVDMLRYLLQIGAKVNEQDLFDATPLCLAVQQQSVECIKLLLEHGARTDIGHHADGPPLHLAVKYDCLEAVGILSRHGADMNLVGGRKKLPPLFLACRQRKAAMARALLAAGADVNMTARDSESGILCTALQEATTTRYMPCVEVLLEHKAAVEVKDGHGWTPLYTALMNRAEDVALKLLDHGAVCTAKAEDGSSVLHAAVASTSLRALQRLLEAGADVNATDNSGNTALLRAIGSKYSRHTFRRRSEIYGRRGMRWGAGGSGAQTIHLDIATPGLSAQSRGGLRHSCETADYHAARSGSRL